MQIKKFVAVVLAATMLMGTVVMADEIEDAKIAVEQADKEKSNAQQELADAQNAESDANKIVIEKDMEEVSANHEYLVADKEYKEALNSDEYKDAQAKANELDEALKAVDDERFFDEDGNRYENDDFMWEQKGDQEAIDKAQNAVNEAQAKVDKCDDEIANNKYFVDGKLISEDDIYVGTKEEVDKAAENFEGGYNGHYGNKITVEYKEDGIHFYKSNGYGGKKTEITEKEAKDSVNPYKASDYSRFMEGLKAYNAAVTNFNTLKDGYSEKDYSHAQTLSANKAKESERLANALKALEDAQNDLQWVLKDGFTEEDSKNFYNAVKAQEKLDRANEKVNEIKGNIDALEKVALEKKDAWDKAIEAQANAVAKAKELYDNSVAKGDAFAKAIAKYNDALDRLNALLNRPTPPTEDEVDEAIEEVTNAANEVVISTPSVAEILRGTLNYALVNGFDAYVDNVLTFYKDYAKFAKDLDASNTYINICVVCGKLDLAWEILKCWIPWLV